MQRKKFSCPNSKPKMTRDGIKTRTSRGRLYTSNWWSRRWMKILESCIDSSRFARGKTYARKGQITNIKIEPGLVTAFVQGTREKPYQIKLGFQTVSEAQKKLLLLRFREKASFAAKLLSMEMPEEMETAFKETGIPLFPNRSAILRFKCTCPDDTVPCKHIIAVLLLLAEVIDENPFLLLKLRGLNRQRLIARLTSETISGDSVGFDDFDIENEENESSCTITGGADIYDTNLVSLEDCPPLDNWYLCGNQTPAFTEEDTHKRIIGLEIMNSFPFWRGEKSFRKTLTPYYERAIIKAFKILTGEKKSYLGRPKKLI
ncbi:MAG: hypothetical protein GXZ18_02435 [Synergistaceae bacterium]|nr:hypothetical protein [Synergistaceae bacterium]